MTREQAREFLGGLGVAEPTDDAITNILNTIGAETKRANEKANAYKAEADKAKDLQKQIDDLNNANLSELEKANKATEQANSRVADLEKQMKMMQLKTDLATQGIVGESADGIIKSLESGSFDASILGNLIAEREKVAVANYEKERLLSTPTPEGNKANAEAEPADVAMAKQLSFGTFSDTNTKNYYKL